MKLVFVEQLQLPQNVLLFLVLFADAEQTDLYEKQGQKLWLTLNAF